MKVTHEGRNQVGALWSRIGGDPDFPDGDGSTDCCDPGPRPDRALDCPAYTIDPPTGGLHIVQSAVGNGGTANSVTLATAPTVGNTLIGLIWRRDTGEPEPAPLGGWTTIAAAADTIGWQRSCAMRYRVVEADESPYQSGANRYIATPSAGDLFQIVEIEGAYASVQAERNSVASTTTMNCGGAVTPSAGTDVLIVGLASIYANHVAGITEDTDVVSLYDAFNSPGAGGFSPYKWGGYRFVEDASGSYTVGGTMTADHFCGVTAVFSASVISTGDWDVPAPNTVDGDDATYHEIDGPDVLRVDLGAAYRIVRARLLIGSENAGEVTYRIRGANAADFSDAVELSVETWTATGSFTGDDIDFLWSTTESYQYFELTGSNETRRIYSFELYEPEQFAGEDHEHQDLQDQIDAIADDISGGFVSKTSGGLETLDPHGTTGATETIDLALGNWHSLTLDADCTVTVSGFTTGSGCSVLVKVTQDGTGGWAITWDADIVWAGDDQPAQGAGEVSWFVLASDEGDGTIYGFPVGGSSVTYATPAIVLGTAAAAGAADSVIRSDATIVAFDATVPVTQAFGDAAATGSAAVAARRDHVHGMPSESSSGGHIHVTEEVHLSDGSTTTFTLDASYESGSIQAWNRTAIARLLVTEVLPDQVTISAAGTTGDELVFDYAATLV